MLRDDRPANLLAILGAGLAGADLGLSMSAFASGNFHEANPLLRPLENHPGWFGFTKASLSAGTIVLIYKYTKPHSKLRYTALASFAVLQGIVVWKNNSVIH